MLTQYRPLEKKKQAKSLKLNVDLLFHGLLITTNYTQIFKIEII